MQLVEMDMMMLEKLKTFSEQKEEENLSLCFVEKLFLSLHLQVPQQSVAYEETSNQWTKI